MKKSRLILLSLILIVCLLFSSCGAADSPVTTSPHDSLSKLKVAVIQYNDSTSFSEMRKAFVARMRTLGYDEAKMSFDFKNAQGDYNRLSEIVASLSSADYDLIVPIASLCAKAVCDAGLKTPSVFMGVSDPIALGLMSSFETPDKNMTGTTYSVNAAEILTLAKVLTPSVTRFGILRIGSDTSAVGTIEAFESKLQDNSYTFEELMLDSTDGIEVKLSDLFSRVDMLFVPPDANLEGVLPAIVSAANASGKFVYATSEGAVDNGALASSGVSYTELGKASAILADKVLQGIDISTVSVTQMNTPTQFISRSAARTLGIDLPTTLENTLIK